MNLYKHRVLVNVYELIPYIRQKSKRKQRETRRVRREVHSHSFIHSFFFLSINARARSSRSQGEQRTSSPSNWPSSLSFQKTTYKPRLIRIILWRYVPAGPTKIWQVTSQKLASMRGGPLGCYCGCFFATLTPSLQ